MQTKTPIDSIEIPPEFLDLAGAWYDGQSSMLYAVASTGGLTLGPVRPMVYGENRHMTDEEWYWSLWSDLASELRSLIRMVEKNRGKARIAKLRRFEEFADQTADRLAAEYEIDI